MFKSTSPKNLPYAEIGKIISNFKSKIKEKWLVSTLFSLASVKFSNEELFENSILFLIEEKKTENLASLSHLAFISEMMQLSLPIRNLVKNAVKKSIENNINEGKLIDPLTSMRIAYIINTFYYQKNDDSYLKPLLKTITGFLEYFSVENLVLFGWSLGKIEKNEEISKFLENFNDFLSKKLKNTNLQPQKLYLINQYQQLTDMILMDLSTERKTIQKLYQSQEEIIEKLEFYKGTRFSTKLIKNEIREILAEEGIIKEMDVLTNSLIQVDFILTGEKNENLVLVHSDEKFCFDLKGEKNLKQIYQNEIEILRKKEGKNVLVINSKEFLQAGSEAKKIEEEKRLKKVFLNKILKGI